MRATPWGSYARIASELRAQLADAAPGSPLPSESVLANRYGVVRNTIRRALAELEREGLIVTLSGRGRVVADGTDIGRTPNYQRIAADLRAEIDSGRLGPGDRVPSEAELMRRYGVSRGTARQGLALIQAAGLVESAHGKGRFVTSAGRRRTD